MALKELQNEKYWERPEVSEEEGKKIINRALDKFLMEEKESPISSVLRDSYEVARNGKELKREIEESLQEQALTELSEEARRKRECIERIAIHHRELRVLFKELGEILFDD